MLIQQTEELPALLKPEREAARQLGVSQEPHAANGTTRWTLASRAANAKQALRKVCRWPTTCEQRVNSR